MITIITGEGAAFDFTISTNMIRLIPRIPAMRMMDVVVTFRVDSIALEPLEDFRIILVPNPAADPLGDGVVLVDSINVFIEDSDS